MEEPPLQHLFISPRIGQVETLALGGSMHNEFRGLQTVLVKREDLLAKIKENRTKHIKEYEEAEVGFKVKLGERLIEMVEETTKLLDSYNKNGDLTQQEMGPGIYVGLQRPVSHAADYDRVIARLEMSVDDQLELDASEFNQYVMDDWTWKAAAMALNSSYMAMGGANELVLPARRVAAAPAIAPKKAGKKGKK